MSRNIKIICSLIFLTIFLFIFTSNSYASTAISAPHIKQLPELPRGCEVTSLAMMLQHAGVKVSKMELAKEVRKVPFKNNGLNGNPYEGFVGNMYTYSSPGLAVYHGPIYDLANQYLPNRVVNLTGTDFSSIYQMIDKGMPVWVITNSWFQPLPASQFITWQTDQGPLKVTYREHSVLIIGYDANFIYINDPLYHKPNRAVNKKDFIAAWNQMGKQAISYYPKNSRVELTTPVKTIEIKDEKASSNYYKNIPALAASKIILTEQNFNHEKELTMSQLASKLLELLQKWRMELSTILFSYFKAF